MSDRVEQVRARVARRGFASDEDIRELAAEVARLEQELADVMAAWRAETDRLSRQADDAHAARWQAERVAVGNVVALDRAARSRDQWDSPTATPLDDTEGPTT